MDFRQHDELRRIGSLKWTGMTRSDGSPALGAWVAEMDFGTAPVVASRIKQAIDDGLTGYPPTWLIPRLTEATAHFQQRHFGWDISPEDVLLIPSVIPGLGATLTHLLPPGSPVVVPTPAYMPFLSLPAQLGHPVIEVPSLHSSDCDGGWALDLEGIRRGLEAGASMVILCNPWNPTGRVLSEAELRAFHEVVSAYDALVFSDEIHSPLVLDDRPFISYASLGADYAAHTITATAASKGWNIAGLPSAQIILPDEELRDRWKRFCMQDLHRGANTLGALGTLAAYEEGDAWLREVLDVLRENMSYTSTALKGSGIDFSAPQGTYLTWWGCENLVAVFGESPASFLLEKAGIAAYGGKVLGRGYEKWLRVNLGCSPQTTRAIVEGVLRFL